MPLPVLARCVYAALRSRLLPRQAGTPPFLAANANVAFVYALPACHIPRFTSERLIVGFLPRAAAAHSMFFRHICLYAYALGRAVETLK